MNIQTWLNSAAERLQNISTTFHLDAEMLLLYVLHINRTFLYTYPEKNIPEKSLQILNNLLEQRLSGIPVAYLLQEKEFWSMSFKVTPDVLIPRPETEHLVETLLNLLDTHKPQRILELGTGSGAIAIALAKERPHWEIIACDNSKPALAIAQENADRLLPNHALLSFQYSHWFEHIALQTFSAIISNPPYIAAEDPHLQKLTFEPSNALISESNGLRDIQKIITGSPAYLNPEGYLLLEHGNKQAAAVSAIFNSLGFKNITTIQDLGGHDRLTFGKF